MADNRAKRRAAQEKARGRFFEKKLRKKLLTWGPRALKTPRSKGAKVFCGAFFQKSDRFLYVPFTLPPTVPSRTLTRNGPHPPPERWFPMGDIISVAAGVVIFALLILYVTGCEKV